MHILDLLCAKQHQQVTSNTGNQSELNVLVSPMKTAIDQQTTEQNEGYSNIFQLLIALFHMHTHVIFSVPSFFLMR